MTHVNVVNGSMQTLSESRNGQFQRCLKSAFIEIVFRYTFVKVSSYRCKDTKNTENVAKKYWINVRIYEIFAHLNV